MIAPTLVVVNPASAGGRTRRRWSETAAQLLGAGIDFVTHFTSRAGEATDVTAQGLREGCTQIIAVGGDGTLNEVVHGFFDASGAAINAAATLGFIPSGTGGDFRKTARIPVDTAAAVRVLRDAHVVAVDAGRIDYDDGTRRHFINIADAGLGGDVVARVNRGRYKTGGPLGSIVFLGASLAALWSFDARRVRITLDGSTTEHDVESVVVANGRYFGGGMHIAPQASIRDGVFDVIIVEQRSFVRSLAGLPQLYRGTHLTQRGVIVRRARQVRIESLAQPLLFDVEGEQIGQAPATLSMLPGAIRLCVPRESSDV